MLDSYIHRLSAVGLYPLHIYFTDKIIENVDRSTTASKQRHNQTFLSNLKSLLKRKLLNIHSCFTRLYLHVSTEKHFYHFVICLCYLLGKIFSLLLLPIKSRLKQKPCHWDNFSLWWLLYWVHYEIINKLLESFRFKFWPQRVRQNKWMTSSTPVMSNVRSWGCKYWTCRTHSTSTDQTWMFSLKLNNLKVS